MYIVIGLALGLIIVGLLMVFFAKHMVYPAMVSVVFWVGFALVVIGLILLLTPVLIWVNAQLRSMLAT